MFIKISLIIQISYVDNYEKKFLINFGKRLKEYRLQKKLSQEMLANDLNIPINQIGRIERAEIATSIVTAYKLAKVLEVPIENLFRDTY